MQEEEEEEEEWEFILVPKVGGGPSSRPDILFVRHSKANKFEFLKCVIKCP